MKSGVYLIKIIKKPIYFLKNETIQFVTYRKGFNRFYVNKGASGHALLGFKSVKVLAYPYPHLISNLIKKTQLFNFKFINHEKENN